MATPKMLKNPKKILDIQEEEEETVPQPQVEEQFSKDDILIGEGLGINISKLKLYDNTEKNQSPK